MTKPEYSDNDKESVAAGRDQEGHERPGRSSGRLRRVQAGGGKRGRRPCRVDKNAKLERSRQSARECRARKKQKYQLLEERVTEKEKQILALREKLEKYKNFCQSMDDGEKSEEIKGTLRKDDADAEEEEEEEEEVLPSTSAHLPTGQQSLGAGDSSSDDEFD